MSPRKASPRALAALTLLLPATATLGQRSAPLFNSVDENMNPVSMADMIDGRPLVMALSSCS